MILEKDQINRKIAILEFERNHFDYVISVHEYLYKKGYKDINIYISKEVFLNLEKELKLIDNHIKKEKIYVFESNSRSKNYYKLISDNIDKIYINTVFYGRDLIFYCILLLLKFKLVLTLHNLKTNFEYNNNFSKEMLKNLMKKFINRKVSGYIVLNKTLKNNAQKYTNKLIDVVSFKLPLKTSYIKEKKDNSNDLIEIIIPGTVNVNRRNYDKIFNVIQKILKVRQDIRFIFLGRIVTKNLKKDILKLKKNYNKNILFFEKYICQSEYDYYMIKSNYILSPLFKDVKVINKNNEIYGETKASGAEFDAYKYNKPLIINSFYEIKNKEINTKYFDDYESLYNILIGLN